MLRAVVAEGELQRQTPEHLELVRDEAEGRAEQLDDEPHLLGRMVGGLRPGEAAVVAELAAEVRDFERAMTAIRQVIEPA